MISKFIWWYAQKIKIPEGYSLSVGAEYLKLEKVSEVPR